MHVDLHLLAEFQDENGGWHPANEIGSLYPGQEFDRQEFVPWWRGYDPAVIALMTGIQIQGLTAIGITPITPPRGLPADLCSEYSAAHTDRQALGTHSHSWLTVAELMAYQWTQLVTIKRRITASEWKYLTPERRREIVEESLRLPSGSIDWEFSGDLIASLSVSFRWPIQTLVESFIAAISSKLQPALERAGGDNQKVRLVFGLSS